MPVNYLAVFFCGFLVSVLLIALLKRPALAYKSISRQGIPRIGGICIGLSLILVCFFGFIIFGGLSIVTIGIIISSSIMLIFGLIDDWRELSVPAKFSVQIIATTILILFGIRTHIIYIGGPLNIIITFIWVLGITNAFNHLDVMDGVAAGTAVIVSCALFVISFLNGDIRTAILTLGLTGTTLGFLIYNLPPAKIYMGNSGSHFLGFILAAIALVISYAPLERKVALFSPFLILGLPLFDTAFLILMRIKQARPVFKKSEDHLALRFLKLGVSKNKALLYMLLLAMFFSVCGVAVSQASNLWATFIIISVVVVSLGVMKKMSKVIING